MLSSFDSFYNKMKKFIGVLVFGVFYMMMLMSLTMARFVVEKNSLTITSPDSIKGTHDSAVANFGVPQYGGSMAGTVVYPKENQKGCNEFDKVSFHKNSAGGLPQFVLLDRGGKFLWSNSLYKVGFLSVFGLLILDFVQIVISL